MSEDRVFPLIISPALPASLEGDDILRDAVDHGGGTPAAHMAMSALADLAIKAVPVDGQQAHLDAFLQGHAPDAVGKQFGPIMIEADLPDHYLCEGRVFLDIAGEASEWIWCGAPDDINADAPAFLNALGTILGQNMPANHQQACLDAAIEENQ